MSAGSSIGSFVKVVNRSLLLVLLAAVGGTFIAGGMWAYISLAALAISILVSLIICARIVAHLKSQTPSNVAALVRDNWRSYLVVTVVLGLPVLTYHFLAQNFAAAGSSPWIREGIKVTVAVISIYSLPIVFLRKVGLVAIPSGIIYLFGSLRTSSLIIAIVLLASAVGAVRYLLFGVVPLPGLVVMILGIGFLATYLHFLAFAAASDVLVRSKRDSPSVA